MFKKLFCLEGFGKVCAKYFFPQLGFNNPESIFEANLYIKSNDNITMILKETYISIVESIHKDYNLAWYIPFFTDENEKNQYISICNQYLDKIEKSTSDDLIPVTYIDCPIIFDHKNDNLSGILPTSHKNKKKIILPIIIFMVIVCPIFVIWLYIIILSKLGIPIDSINTAIGTVISAAITSTTALLLTRKRQN